MGGILEDWLPRDNVQIVELLVALSRGQCPFLGLFCIFVGFYV